RAREAQQRQREAVVLYDVVRLLSEGELTNVLSGVAERLRVELRLQAVAVDLWQPDGSNRRFSAGDVAALQSLSGRSTGRVLQRGGSGSATGHAAPGRWVRIVHPTKAASWQGDVHLVPITVGERRVGAL